MRKKSNIVKNTEVFNCVTYNDQNMARATLKVNLQKKKKKKNVISNPNLLQLKMLQNIKMN